MLQLLKTQVKLLCLASQLLVKMKGVSPEVSVNFGPGRKKKSPLLLNMV